MVIQDRIKFIANCEMDNTVFKTAHQIAASIRNGEVSITELVEAYLARIKQYNPALNAIVVLDEEGARRRTHAADQALLAGTIWGPLHGVPITIKDVFNVAGMRTTIGYRPLRQHVPQSNATIVDRLLDAGAIILGHTNVPELSFDYQCKSPIYGRTNNPWSIERTPGGSSGGSAAAVAAGLSALDIGSDTGGSIRLPAHYCGVYGLKPTEHRVSGAGHAEIPGMLHGVRHITVCGPLARSVDDLELALQIIEGADGKEWEVPPVSRIAPIELGPSECRIAWSEDLGVPVEASVRNVLRNVASKLEQAGCYVEKCDPPDFDIEEALLTWGEIIGAEMGASMPAHLRWGWRLIFPFRYGDSAWTRGYVRGLNNSLRQYTAALTRRDKIISRLEQFLAKWTVWLCPVSSTAAFTRRPIGTRIEVDGESVPYTLAAGAYASVLSMTGNPVVSLPAGQTGEGLPVGIQVVGRRWHDMEMLGAAKMIDKIVSGYKRPHNY